MVAPLPKPTLPSNLLVFAMFQAYFEVLKNPKKVHHREKKQTTQNTEKISKRKKTKK